MEEDDDMIMMMNKIKGEKDMNMEDMENSLDIVDDPHNDQSKEPHDDTSLSDDSVDMKQRENVTTNKAEFENKSNSRKSKQVSMSSTGVSFFSVDPSQRNPVNNEKRSEYRKKLAQFQSDFKRIGANQNFDVSSYENLLNQFGELQKDLFKTLTYSQKLQNEHESLAAHYNVLKNEHIKLREKLIESRGRENDEIEARILMEQRQDELIKRWQKQLEVKAKEVDDLQLQVNIPRNNEYHKLKLQEELDAVYKAQQKKLETEIERSKTAHATVSHQYQILKTEYEQYVTDRTTEFKSCKAAHAKELEKLEEEIVGMRKTMESMNQQEQTRQQSLIIEKLRTEGEFMKEKLRDANDEVESLKIELDGIKVALQREKIECGIAVKESQVALASEQNKLQATVLELDQCRELLGTANRKVLEHQSESLRLKGLVETRDKVIGEERIRLSKEMTEMKMKSDREKQELRSAIDSLEGKIGAMENRHAEQLRIRENQFESAIRSHDQMKSKLLQSYNEARDSVERMHQQSEDTRRDYEARVRELIEESEKTKANAESAIAECRRAVTEKNVLHEKMTIVTDQLRDSRQTTERQEKQLQALENEYSELQDTHRSYINASLHVKAKAERFEARAGNLENELSQLEKEKMDIKLRLEDAVRQSQELVVELEGKENVIMSQVAETLVESTEGSRKMLSKLDKQCKIYKDALEKCKVRIRELLTKLHRVTSDAKSQQRMFQQKEQSLLRKIKTLEGEVGHRRDLEELQG